MNKRTVADLIGKPEERYGRGPIERGEASVNYTNTGSSVAQEATLREMVLVVDPSECEIVDGMVVIEKRFITHSRDEALQKFGVRFK